MNESAGRTADPVDRRLAHALIATALAGAVVGSVGAPLITAVATSVHVSLGAAQWTLTVTLFTGAIAAPVLGRLGGGPRRRSVIVGTLALVVVGGILTVLPAPFWVLLVGRGLQGLAVGVVALLMSVARSHLSAERAASTIAALSVATTVGIGVGYPIISLTDQLLGLRAAYGLGVAVSVAALLISWRALPAESAGRVPRIDGVGTMLLAVATLGVLIVIAEPAIWSAPAVAVGILVGVTAVLAVWARWEWRQPDPLVDLRLLGRAPILCADLAALIAGGGLYLLFSVFTRYVQTPSRAQYGFALPGVAAGAALIPFSVMGFAAGRWISRFDSRRSTYSAYLVATTVSAGAGVTFVLGSGSLPVVLGAIALLGFGVGGVFAVMPRLVLVGVPRAETASVLAINQIARSIGMSAGSALAGFALARSTPPGAEFPSHGGYLTTALWALPVLAVSAAIVAVGRRSS